MKSARQKSTTRIEHDIVINANKDAVWRVIADLGGIQSYHPAVQKSYYSTRRQTGVGAARVCEFGGGRSVEEHAVEWNDGESFLLELRNGKGMPPFRKARARMHVEGQGDKTRVRMTFEYQLKFGLLGILLNRLVVRSQFEKVVPMVLNGLKRHLEVMAPSESMAM